MESGGSQKQGEGPKMALDRHTRPDREEGRQSGLRGWTEGGCRPVTHQPGCAGLVHGSEPPLFHGATELSASQGGPCRLKALGQRSQKHVWC